MLIVIVHSQSHVGGLFSFLPLQTATRLMSDCFLRWQFDEWTEKLHLQPCVPELVYPYWNSFDEDLTSLLDEKVADGKRRKIELRNAVFKEGINYPFIGAGSRRYDRWAVAMGCVVSLVLGLVFRLVFGP